jgi:hypothetical protein
VASRVRRPAAVAWLIVGLGVFGSPVCAQETAPIRLDDFETLSGWTAHPADGVELKLQPDTGLHGRAMRMDFGFTGGGYAVARKALPVELPENYVFSFSIRGEAPVNHLEFKLLDASGENVWWSVRRDFAFPGNWEPFRIRRRQIQYA